MLKLLRAGVYRYCKSVAWWVCVAASFLAAIICVQAEVGIYSSVVDATPLLFVQIIFACLISLIAGREVSENLIRNKILAGHAKEKALLSEVLLGIAACLILLLVFIITLTAQIGELLSAIPLKVKVLVLLGTILLSIVCIMIDVLISLFFRHYAVSAIVCLLLAVGMAFGAGELQTALQQPEFTTGMEFVYNGKTGKHEVEFVQIKNPNYVQGNRRLFYRFLLNVLPYGHGIEYASVMTDHIQNEDPFQKENGVVIDDNLYYAGGVILFLGVLGMFYFKRKDLK